MLEPISPSHRPEKPPQDKEEVPLAETDNIEDSEGYRFNFFGRSRKRKEKKTGATQKQNVYNNQEAVNLTLSPEAEEELEKQRRLKEQSLKDQDPE